MVCVTRYVTAIMVCVTRYVTAIMVCVTRYVTAIMVAILNVCMYSKVEHMHCMYIAIVIQRKML